MSSACSDARRLGPWPGPSPLDRAAVMFTSGTTGAPKGVEITQANYAFAGAIMAGACGLAAEHRQLVVLPMFHANAQYYSFASAIAVGASVALDAHVLGKRLPARRRPATAPRTPACSPRRSA